MRFGSRRDNAGFRFGLLGFQFGFDVGQRIESRKDRFGGARRFTFCGRIGRRGKISAAKTLVQRTPMPNARTAAAMMVMPTMPLLVSLRQRVTLSAFADAATANPQPFRRCSTGRRRGHAARVSCLPGVDARRSRCRARRPQKPCKTDRR
jgi:hypothetical protein